MKGYDTILTMSIQVLKLGSALQLQNVAKNAPCRVRITSTAMCQRFRHLGHDRRFQSANFMPLRKVIESFKSVRVYSTGNNVDSKSKDQTENILTIPNVLTVGRMLMCPVLGYLVIHNEYPTAFGLFIAAGITDLVIHFYSLNS